MWLGAIWIFSPAAGSFWSVQVAGSDHGPERADLRSKEISLAKAEAVVMMRTSSAVVRERILSLLVYMTYHWRGAVWLSWDKSSGSLRGIGERGCVVEARVRFV